MKIYIEDLSLNDYYGITLTTKKGKILYLEMHSGKPTWTFDKRDACVWSTEELAEQFANAWFKEFTNYEIRPILKM